MDSESSPPKRRRWALRLAVFFVLLVAGDLMLVRKWRQIPIAYDTTRVSGPVLPDGCIDYVAALDAEVSRGVADDNNAAQLLVQACGPSFLPVKLRAEVAQQLHMTLPPENGSYFISFNDFEAAKTKDNSERPELDFSQWPMGNSAEVARWLKANEQPLPLILQATDRPRFFVPMRAGMEAQTIIGALRPYLNQYRGMKMLLGADAQMRAGAGDFAGARADVRAMHRLARLASQNPTLAERLVGTGIDVLACHIDRNIAQHATLDAAQCDEFLKDALALQELPSLAEAIDTGERYNVLDVLQSMAIRGPAATDRIYSPGNAGPAGQDSPLHFVVPMRHADGMRHANALYDEMVAAFEKTGVSERRAAFAAVEKKAETFAPGPLYPASTRILISILRPSMMGPQNAMDRVSAELGLTKIAWALARYHIKMHKYPTTLADLVPQYLPTQLVDPFGTGPYSYAPKEAGYTLYSVGPNGVDDHGGTTFPADAIDASTE